VDGQIGQVFEDLRRELARRRQHERARRAARLVDQLVENRQQERGGLAAAGHRARQEIASGHRRRNRVGLNRRRPRIAEVFEAPQEVRVQLQVRERHA